jgi:peroxiredoxin Q/BCP
MVAIVRARRFAAALMVAGLLAGCAQRGFHATPQQMEDAASARSPIVGLAAPDFSLKDQNGRTVTLAGLRGQWVVLYFYPKDDTPGCTCEATEFTKLMGHLRDLNARVYGVSDDSVATHQVFVEKFKLGLDLLSDSDHTVMRCYGAWVTARLGDKTYDRVIRSTMIIDPQGIIRYHWPEVIPEGHAQRVREKLRALQAPAAPR